MNVAVIGLWHLGMVTAACLAAEGHTVCAIDEPEIVAEIEAGRLPVNEPGLAPLLAENRAAGRLSFGSDPNPARAAELIWFCYDTPVDDDDRPDVGWVTARIGAFLAEVERPMVIAISSQLPVGSVAALAATMAGRGFAFACIPENLRLGSAIAYFRKPDRFVIGTDTARARDVLQNVVGSFAPTIVWTSIESAEVVKHAINAFLATSVVFANELAAICERVGADARDVERGLKTDVRVGPKAYVRAGESFAGGTLARDLAFLAEIGDRNDLSIAQLRATAASNEQHRGWVSEQLAAVFGSCRGLRVALLGLVYKPGTDTLRASNAVALARRLVAAGAHIRGFDPAIGSGDGRLVDLLEVMPSAQQALADADVAIVATAWPEFRELTAADFAGLRSHTVIDETRYLETTLSMVDGLRYLAFGRPAPASVAW